MLSVELLLLLIFHPRCFVIARKVNSQISHVRSLSVSVAQRSGWCGRKWVVAGGWKGDRRQTARAKLMLPDLTLQAIAKQIINQHFLRTNSQTSIPSTFVIPAILAVYKKNTI